MSFKRLERLLEHSPGESAEAGRLLAEPGLERGVCACKFQLTHGPPGPESHGAVGIADQRQEDVLQGRVVLGQAPNAPTAVERKARGWPYRLYRAASAGPWDRVVSSRSSSAVAAIE